MRAAILFTWVLIFAKPCYSQHNIVDSLQKELRIQKTDTARAIILYNLSSVYQVYKPDSALLLAQEAYNLSVKHHFLKGQSWALNQMAGAFSRMGNNTKALEYYLQQLKIEEERKGIDALAIINMNIALVYNSEKDKDKAIFYILQADSIVKENKLGYLELYSLLNTGDIYEKAGMLPEALRYTNECYILALKNRDSLMAGSALNNLGNIYSKMSRLPEAISSYQASVPYLSSQNDYQTISEGKLGLAKAFTQSNLPDSALQYAREAYSVSSQNAFLKNAFGASTLLAQLYKNKNRIDSAFVFQESMILLKDSIEGVEKAKLLESMTIGEQLRQKQLQAQAAQEKEDQRQRLQLLAIGISIPLFFFLSLYLSKRRVKRKVIEFAGVLSLLMLFEYITLLIHPVVKEITHHTPLLEIIIFVAIAALAVPAHHKIEHWFIKHLAWLNEKYSKPKETVPVIADEIITGENSPGNIAAESTAEDENKNALPGNDTDRAPYA
ncbi:MAG: tetratricopeptide repeat protein [Ferruginibacter sp.]